jgi:uncharacterized protein (DUF1684 family)
MTITESTFQQDWAVWHAAREKELATPHGWLSLTALHWLDETAQTFDDVPGTWRATGDGGVELTAAGDVVLDGRPVEGTARIEPVDGKPGVLVEIGERKVEVIRRTDSYALRVRDPQAITRTAFTGVPAFPVDERWVVEGRFEPYPEPKRLTVGAVVDGLQHFPTGAGVVRFALGGAEQTLVAFPGTTGGLSLHFWDATSGKNTYGGGRSVQIADPDADGRVTIDFNRTLNLPCAFTSYATCPLPPAENRLAVPVEAGERTPSRPDLTP